MKAITKPILGAVTETRVLKQIYATYFSNVGIPDLDMTKMKCQNKRQNKTNFNLSCFRGIYNCCNVNINRYRRLVSNNNNRRLILISYFWRVHTKLYSLIFNLL
jgi:hypothetical protein